jgi:cyclic pyranopterin phosphate synthase
MTGDAPQRRSIDPLGRRVSYLRLSVTDLCNLRCTYCMPAEGVRKLSHAEILTLEELAEVARAAIALGVTKVRITGGEPLIRRGILSLVRSLASSPGLETLALTTNGTQLAQMARPLAEAGILRLNVSLDSLEPETFARITRGGDVSSVVAGIDAARAAGLPVKINAVLLAGVNTGGIAELAAFARGRGAGLRFIELMRFDRDLPLFSEADAIGALREKGDEVAPLPIDPAEPHVRRFAYRGAVVGFIAAVTRPFCGACNKIRLTPEGALKPCLASDAFVDARSVLRRPHTAADVERVVAEAIRKKPAAAPWSAPSEMWKVGG